MSSNPTAPMINHVAPSPIMVHLDDSVCTLINHAPWVIMVPHDYSLHTMINYGAPRLIMVHHGGPVVL